MIRVELLIRNMNEKYAQEIICWQYEEPYDFYNNELSEESLREFLDNPYFAIMNEQEELIGFYCTGSAAQVPKGHDFNAYSKEYIDIGIGMKPTLTGKGFGTKFFSFIINNIQQEYTMPLRLTVAQFNKRAIFLYEKLGFVKELEFSTPTEFITMLKKL